MPDSPTVEICVDSLDLALAAVRGGADRLELCGPLHGGGVTPSAGLVQTARRLIDLPLAMLVRPRTGPFTATEAEFEVMRRDVLFARGAGMDLVVLGLLHPDRSVDVERTRELVELAHPVGVTFHRAFDTVDDQNRALAAVIATGAQRILTSGGKGSVSLGAPEVAKLRPAAMGRIGLMLCGGVHAANVEASLQISGADEVHAALRGSIGPGLAAGVLSQGDLDHFADAVTALKTKVVSQHGAALSHSS